MTDTAPRVSVIIPCYNLGAYVSEAVESVLAQTEQDLEILVVDDGSTDASTSALLTGARWPKTTVFTTANRGVCAARNFLLQKARGEFVCALDADDILHPDYLAATLSALDADASLTFVSTRMRMFGDEEKLWPVDARCDLPALLVDDPVFSAALVRRSAVVDAGGFDERLEQGNEDWDLWITLLERGGRGVILPDVLFFYRRRAGSRCDECTRGDTHLALMEYLVRKHAASYATHADFVMRCKDAALAEIRRINDRLEDDVRLLERRSNLTAEPAELDAWKAECLRARAEIEELRRSRSWKATAPARLAYDAWLAARRRSS